jgi:hypothetical protein
MAHVVESLPSKCEVLSSNSSAAGKKKKSIDITHGKKGGLFFFFFGQYWSLNSGLYTCSADLHPVRMYFCNSYSSVKDTKRFN